MTAAVEIIPIDAVTMNRYERDRRDAANEDDSNSLDLPKSLLTRKTIVEQAGIAI
jgi:hypothetical protein